MTDHVDVRVSLGSYLLGALDPAERAETETHLQDCSSCRNELQQLSAIPGLLSRLDIDRLGDRVSAVPQSLLDGLMARALPIEIARRHRLRRWRTATVSLVAVGALVGFLLIPAATERRPPGPTYQLGAAPGTGRITGQVTLVSKPWGTELMMSLSHLPATSTCDAVVTGHDGRVEVIGHWGPTRTHDAALILATDMKIRDLTSLTVKTSAGQVLFKGRLTL